ncbi:MAG: hypothetical protein H0X37_11970 [Herpetosiphonaceae bacterium]|nr:hypothetical protein [Herpetosiphonaceae bacterium]
MATALEYLRDRSSLCSIAPLLVARRLQHERASQIDDNTPTPRFRIVLTAANQEFDYHSNMQRVRWCDKGCF